MNQLILNNIEIILGFLSGSLMTLVIKSIIDFINKKVEFNRELKKKFFEKKLDAADKAVSSFYSLATSIGTLSATYDLMSSTDKEFNNEYFKNLNTGLTETIKKISDNSILGVNSIHLYSDFDENSLWTFEDDKRLLDNMSDLLAKDANLLNALAAHEYSLQHESKERQDRIWADIEVIVYDYKVKMKEVAIIFEDAKIALLEQRKRLRQEFRKYDK